MAETGLTWLQAKESQELTAIILSWRRRARILLIVSKGTQPCLHLHFGLLISKSCERTHFCCFSPPVHGPMFQQPQESNVGERKGHGNKLREASQGGALTAPTHRLCTPGLVKGSLADPPEWAGCARPTSQDSEEGGAPQRIGPKARGRAGKPSPCRCWLCPAQAPLAGPGSQNR